MRRFFPLRPTRLRFASQSSPFDGRNLDYAGGAGFLLGLLVGILVGLPLDFLAGVLVEFIRDLKLPVLGRGYLLVSLILDETTPA